MQPTAFFSRFDWNRLSIQFTGGIDLLNYSVLVFVSWITCFFASWIPTICVLNSTQGRETSRLAWGISAFVLFFVFNEVMLFYMVYIAPFGSVDTFSFSYLVQLVTILSSIIAIGSLLAFAAGRYATRKSHKDTLGAKLADL